MRGDDKKNMVESPQERCDIRVWSDQCRNYDEPGTSNAYRCTSCGTIKDLDHEVHHEIFPHVCGDTDNLS